MKTNRSKWSVDYSIGKYPVITLTNVEGSKLKFDINEIVKIAESEIYARSFKIIEELSK